MRGSIFSNKALFCFSAALVLVQSLAAAPSKIAEVKTYGNFETAGIIIKVEKMDFDESAKTKAPKTR